MKRGKKAYIAFTIKPETHSNEFKPNAQSIKQEILAKLLLLFGQLTQLRVSKEFNILYYNSTNNYGIIQVSNDFNQELLCCIAVIRNLAKHNVRIAIIHIGRTLKKCKEIIVQLHLNCLERDVTHKSILESTKGDFLDSAIESLKAISLLPH